MKLWATGMPWSSWLQYWVIVWWTQKDSIKVWSWNIKFWAEAWVTTQWWIAVATSSINTKIVNEKALERMDADAVKRSSTNASIWRVWDGLYASLQTWFTRDYIEWTINKHNELNKYLRDSLKAIFDDEKFKTFFSDWKLDTTKRDELKWFLREKLWEAGEKNQKVVDAAVENLYSWLMYYSNWLNFDIWSEKSWWILFNLSSLKLGSWI